MLLWSPTVVPIVGVALRWPVARTHSSRDKWLWLHAVMIQKWEDQERFLCLVRLVEDGVRHFRSDKLPGDAFCCKATILHGTSLTKLVLDKDLGTMYGTTYAYSSVLVLHAGVVALANVTGIEGFMI